MADNGLDTADKQRLDAFPVWKEGGTDSFCLDRVARRSLIKCFLLDLLGHGDTQALSLPLFHGIQNTEDDLLRFSSPAQHEHSSLE